jgi:hypothetical protein
MQLFKKYFNDKLKDPSFKELFAQECHVCRNTLRIFNKMSNEDVSIEEMAVLLQVDPQPLQQLLDADYCDPYLVVRLCLELDLPHPGECPRRKD